MTRNKHASYGARNGGRGGGFFLRIWRDGRCGFQWFLSWRVRRFHHFPRNQVGVANRAGGEAEYPAPSIT
jgi:hypothetical protein